MTEVVPGLAQARAMLGNIDSSKIIVGGVGLLVIIGTLYATSSGKLAVDQVQLNSQQIAANLARVGTLALTKPPAPPAAAPAAETPATEAPAATPAAETPAAAPATEAPAAAPVTEAQPDAAPAIDTSSQTQTQPVEPGAPDAVQPPVETMSAPAVVESAPVAAEQVPASAPPIEVAAPVPTAVPMAHPQPGWMLHMKPLQAPQR